jgi:hypothetical protein
MKICAECNEVKPSTDFYSHSGGDGLMHICKICHRLRIPELGGHFEPRA